MFIYSKIQKEIQLKIWKIILIIIKACRRI